MKTPTTATRWRKLPDLFKQLFTCQFDRHWVKLLLIGIP